MTLSHRNLNGSDLTLDKSECAYELDCSQEDDISSAEQAGRKEEERLRRIYKYGQQSQANVPAAAKRTTKRRTSVSRSISLALRGSLPVLRSSKSRRSMDSSKLLDAQTLDHAIDA
jgi:hypothetical protein